MALQGEFIDVSFKLDQAGLVWHPEIGDEVSSRGDLRKISILVDPQGLTPFQLRETFVWLPTVEQLVDQFEARQALIYHAGVNESMAYETVIRTTVGVIEATAVTLRVALGVALEELLSNVPQGVLH